MQTVYEMYVPSQVYPHQPLIVGTGYLVDEQRARPGTVDLISPPVDLVADAPDHDATEFMNTFGLDPSRCRVVIVSRLDEAMKELGIRQTIEAMALVDREHVDLVIVGTGDAEARLHAVADRVNQELGRSAVTFCGSMHDPRWSVRSRRHRHRHGQLGRTRACVRQVAHRLRRAGLVSDLHSGHVAAAVPEQLLE